jgi:excisionase family DNA binding protein
MINENVLSVEPLTVNVKEAARMLGVCERTIRNLTKLGELPVIRIASRVLYSREDLIEFIRQRSKQELGNKE